jgi:hypothetical protein
MEEVHNLNSSPNIIRLMKSRGMIIAALVKAWEKIEVHIFLKFKFA